MYDFGHEQRPLSSQERWAGGVFLAVLVGLFVAEVFHDYHPVELIGLLIVLFWVPQHAPRAASARRCLPLTSTSGHAPAG